MLDEPLGALDAKLRKALQIELKALQENVGITFIYVTHDQEEALTMSDRLAVMSAGRIEQLGTPSDVYEQPTSAYVADFLGLSNLMAAEAVGASAERRVPGDAGYARTASPEPEQWTRSGRSASASDRNGSCSAARLGRQQRCPGWSTGSFTWAHAPSVDRCGGDRIDPGGGTEPGNRSLSIAGTLVSVGMPEEALRVLATRTD